MNQSQLVVNTAADAEYGKIDCPAQNGVFIFVIANCISKKAKQTNEYEIPFDAPTLLHRGLLRFCREKTSESLFIS